MYYRMFSDDKQFVPSERDHNGAYLIDRSPHYFKVILNYLRTNKIILDDGISPQGEKSTIIYARRIQLNEGNLQ